VPQPRKYQSNAERQAAYRRRKVVAEASGSGAGIRPQSPLVKRVMAADSALAREA
jgi:hypothetical protein